ncbi:MAG: AI-2E family transporter [Anaerolineales bacterium]|nr:AI-2E family transporter [Anaerolineales bacterium]MCW5856514.1 AI-2E family transporter [Anaerolineales bacterium]
MPKTLKASPTEKSPRWNSTTKLIAGLTLVAIVGTFVVRFSGFLGPILSAFIFSYLLHPLVSRLTANSRLSWRAAVNIVFVVFIVLLGWLLTMAGVVIVEQMANLVKVVEGYVQQLPELLHNLGEAPVVLGPFSLDFSGLEQSLIEGFNLDFARLGQEVISTVQPALGQAGSLLGAVATSTIATLGWFLFIFILTYMILSEAGDAPNLLRGADLPGHDNDIRRIGREISRTWNAFLRGQLMLVGIIIISSFTLMSVLGVRYALALALITGLAKFVPYIGSFAMYVTTALVAFFQPENYLGIDPGTNYMLVATIPAFLMDMVFDNLVTPRFLGSALGVHPAAVLVTALLAANLLGFVGLILAAPVLASLQLIARFIMRKILDLDPWPEPEKRGKQELPLSKYLRNLASQAKQRVLAFFNQLEKRTKKK